MMAKAWMLGALSVAACGVDTAPDRGASWTIDQVTDDGAILGVWGTGPHDVWAVGGGGGRALLLHNDGTRWARTDIAAPMLFSAYGFSGDDVYAIGDAGLILHYDGSTWTRIESGTTLPLFGLWGASGDDVWIVGGSLAAPGGAAVVLRGSHGSFAPVTDLPAGLMPDVLFKVHGFDANHIVMVGNGVLRWDGVTWTREDPTSQTLFATWGRGANDMYAVGGRGMAEILHSDGHSWTQVLDEHAGFGLRAVFTSFEGPTIAVGESALAFEIDRDGSIAQAVLPELGPDQFLHGVWGDGHGTTYVAASDYPRATSGVILRRR